MSKSDKKFKILIIITAVLVGLLYVLPQFLIWYNLSNLNQPYIMMQLSHHSDEAYGGIARYREIYDGHFPPDDLYFDSNNPSLFGPFPVPMILMSLFIFLTGGDINLLYLLSHLIIPPILFLLFYLLWRKVLKDKLWAFFLAIVCILTPIFNHLPYAFSDISIFLNVVVKNFYPLVKTPLLDLFLARTMDPMLTYLVLLPAITLLVIFWNFPNKKNALCLGIFIGVMFYTYFHYWVFLVILTGLIFIYALWRRKLSPHFFKSTLLLVVTTIIISIPYLVNFYLFSRLAGSQDISERFGITKGRNFNVVDPSPIFFDYFVYILLGVLVYFIFYKRRKNIAFLYWIFLASMFLVWNVQLVIGYVPQPDHWFKTVSPFIAIIIVHAIYEIVSKYINRKAVFAVFLTLSLLLATKKIVNVSIFFNPPEEFLKEYSFNSRITDSWSWVDKSLKKEPVIISPSFITSVYLANQTSARPFLALGFNSGQPNNVLEERFLLANKLFGVDSSTLENIFKADPVEFCGNDRCYNKDFHETLNILKGMRNLYGQYYKKGQEGENRKLFRYVSEEKASDLLGRYENLSVKWKDVGFDYVYYGPWEKQLANGPAVNGIVPIFKNSEVTIYKPSQ